MQMLLPLRPCLTAARMSTPHHFRHTNTLLACVLQNVPDCYLPVVEICQCLEASLQV